MIGTTIGPYRVLGKLGAGGMGEVYRARDAKLGRDVALKVLPPAFALAPDRVSRFRREAQVLAALNHPNIAAIYGFEDDGPVAALVMELVEGLTLAEIIEGSRLTAQGSGPDSPGALSQSDVLAIARQIVAAMEAAHAQGVIHRDLKPANVKVRPDGTVKVLDFGLAKALDPAHGAGQAMAQSGVSNSPTITSPAMTALGMILGTAAYMSPEQAKGRSVDERADVWAFGCTLFEMLTGRRAFAGDDVSDTLANILKSEPDWSALPEATPPSLRRLLRRCLSKDLAGRLPDIRVARLEIDDATSPDLDARPALPTSSTTTAASRSKWPLVALGAAVAALLAALALTVSNRRETATPTATVRFSIPPPSGHTFDQTAPAAMVSPDGQHVLYRVSASSEPARMWLYSMATQNARRLEGTDRAGMAIWSPDGRAFAFVADGRLKRLDLAGGSVQTIAGIEASAGAGGSWNRDGTIILGDISGGLKRVSAAGGELAPLTTLDTSQEEGGHIVPQFLPDGRRFIFTVLPGNVVRLGSLDEPAHPSKVLDVGTHAYYAPPGYLLYSREGTLVAHPFDASRGTVSGDPHPIAEGVRLLLGAYGMFSVSENGVLVYESGDATAGGTPVWVDRNGRTAPAVTGDFDNALFPRLSPDGRRLAVIQDGDLWVQDLAGRPPIKLTFDGRDNPNFSPLWTPDGHRIVYERQSPQKLHVLASDGSSATATTLGPAGHFHPYGWSSDGQELVAVRLGGNADIVGLPPAGETAPREVVATAAREGADGTSISPDGRWIAYAASPTGQNEIWVRPFPGPGAPVRVSPSGGAEPVWARNGRELFYVEPAKQQLMAVSVQAGPEFRFSTPIALFGTNEFVVFSQPPSYDVAPDGRLLMLKRTGRVAPGMRPLTVVLNWDQELKRLVPTR